MTGEAGTDGYQGDLGRTRSQRIQVWAAGGQLQMATVCVGVDAQADPDLATAARAGTLHQLEGGLALAIPFIYHDPEERAFLLVVPEALSHEALSLRAQHMAEVAGDTDHPVPEYVRDVEVVIGASGLVQRLEDGRPQPLLAELKGLSPEALRARTRAVSMKERELQRLAEALAQPQGGYVATVTDMTPVMDEELEVIDEPEDDAEPVDDRELSEPAPELFSASPGRHSTPISDTIEIVSDAEAEDVSDAPIAASSHSDIVRAVPVPSSMPPNRAPSDPDLDAMALPPAAFVDSPGDQVCAVEQDGRVWVFARGVSVADASNLEMDLLVQVDPDAEVPVVLWTLVIDPGGSPEIRRGFVDLADSSQTAALTALAVNFEVELVALDPGGGLEHFATLQSPREPNVEAVLAHLDQAPDPEPEAFDAAVDELLSHPPPWRDLTHPFQLGDSPEAPLTATETAVVLDQVAEWIEPQRAARVQLLLSVPDELVLARCREAVEDGLGWGLSLPQSVRTMAVNRGLARDEVDLLERRISGLCRTTRDPDHGGLGESVLRTLWADALEQAAHHGVSLDKEAAELAAKHGGERGAEQAAALTSDSRYSMEPLRHRVEGDSPDPAAAQELAERGGHQELLEVCHAAGRMHPEDAARLFVLVAKRGDEASRDALLAALTHGEAPQERFGAALALAAQHASPAIEELAVHVAGEEEGWAGFAHALGRYGGGSYRAIVRSLSDKEVDPERLAHVYAHLALHGARAQVRSMARKRDPNEAKLGERALELANDFKTAPVWCRGLEPDTSLTVFSKLFDEGWELASGNDVAAQADSGPADG